MTFKSEKHALLYIYSRLWPDGAICPECHGKDRITARKREEFFRCNSCKYDFTVRTGTVFARSHIPLSSWVYAICLMRENPPTSEKLSEILGLSKKTAWFMQKRIREASQEQLLQLEAIYRGMKS
jgi:transposase-like protein